MEGQTRGGRRKGWGGEKTQANDERYEDRVEEEEKNRDKFGIGEYEEEKRGEEGRKDGRNGEKLNDGGKKSKVGGTDKKGRKGKKKGKEKEGR